MTRGTHLTPEAVIDVLDGTVSDERRRHIEMCDVCRARVESARACLTEAARVKVPEPSPLFWEHLSARVHDAVAAESVPAVVRPWWMGWRFWSLAASAAGLLLVVGMTVRQPAPVSPTIVMPRSDAALATASDWLAAPGEDDESWALVTTLADAAADAGDLEQVSTVTAATSQAFDPEPGTSEIVAASLSADEQLALARLIEAELAKRPATE